DAPDDRARVAQAAAGGCGGARDETGDGLPAIYLDPTGGFDFRVAADLADHDHAVGVGVVVEHPDDIQVRRTIHRISADADAGALAESARRELVNRLIGQGPGPGHDTDMAPLVNVAGSDPDAAAAVGLFT